MMTRRIGRHALLASLLSVLLLFVACADPAADAASGAPVPTGDARANVASGDVAPEVHATTSATPGVAGSALEGTHGGWALAGCAACHALAHGATQPSGCALCHGTNGAPVRPAGHGDDGCDGCHGGTHAGRGFQGPGDCRACHGYAADDAPCPVTEEVDVVVVGGGGGGLSAASRLAQAGLEVVVLERHHKVGGCMTAFHRGDYRFEVSLHAMGGFDEPDGSNVVLFDRLGILDRVQPVDVEYMYRTVYPDFTFDTHRYVDHYLADLIERFPGEADGLTLLFAHLAEAEVVLDAAVAQLNGDGGPLGVIMTENPDAVTRFMGYLDKTLSEVLVDYITDPQLFAVFTQLAAYAGAEPDVVSSLFFIMMWNGYHRSGFYYLIGGSQSISDALAAVIREQGGQVRTSTEVTDIVIEDGVAVEVRAAGGACFRPRYVVSNASGPATVELIGRPNLPEDYVASIDAMRGTAWTPSVR